MKEIGTVIKSLNEKIALIKLEKSTACAGCNRCNMGASGEWTIEAKNDIDAREGEVVLVEISERVVLISSFIIYILPIIFLICGYFVGVNLKPFKRVLPETNGIIFSFCLFFLSFVLLKFFDTLFSKNKICARIERRMG